MRDHDKKTRPFPCGEKISSAARCSLERRRLTMAMAITGATMLLEIAGGLWSNSLALLSDAGHMFSHLFALGVSYCAILLSCRTPTEAQSFGFYRAEILAAIVNGISLLVIVAWILYEAWGRLAEPSPVRGAHMFVVATIGLAVNGITALILRDASKNDLNIRSAFIHVIGDLGSSVGVVGAALVISFTGWTAIDPIVSGIIALVILTWSVKLLWDAARILLQSTPRHMNPGRIASALVDGIAEIRGVHHVHVWELTSGMYVMTAHVEVDDMPLSQAEQIRERALELLSSSFEIRHANLQFESRRRAGSA